MEIFKCNKSEKCKFKVYDSISDAEDDNWIAYVDIFGLHLSKDVELTDFTADELFEIASEMRSYEKIKPNHWHNFRENDDYEASV